MILNRRSRKHGHLIRTMRPTYKPSKLDISKPAMMYVVQLYYQIRRSGVEDFEARELIWNVIFYSTQINEHPTVYTVGNNGQRPRNLSTL